VKQCSVKAQIIIAPLHKSSRSKGPWTVSVPTYDIFRMSKLSSDGLLASFFHPWRMLTLNLLTVLTHIL